MDAVTLQLDKKSVLINAHEMILIFRTSIDLTIINVDYFFLKYCLTFLGLIPGKTPILARL